MAYNPVLKSLDFYVQNRALIAYVHKSVLQPVQLGQSQSEPISELKYQQNEFQVHESEHHANHCHMECQRLCEK